MVISHDAKGKDSFKSSRKKNLPKDQEISTISVEVDVEQEQEQDLDLELEEGNRNHLSSVGLN